MLDCASEMRLDAVRGIDLPSPAELSRLGVWETRKLPELAVLIFGSFLCFEVTTPLAVLPSDMRFLSDMGSFVEREVEGLEDGGGGCGKEPILMVFLTFFVELTPNAFAVADPALTVGTSGVDCAACEVGSKEGREGAFMRVGVTGRLLRGGLGWGMGGRAAVGGSAAGRARTGRDMVQDSVDITRWERNVLICNSMDSSLLDLHRAWEDSSCYRTLFV